MHKTIKSLSLISFFILLSKILGLIRESFIAYFFGASESTDAYFLSLNINQSVIVIIGSAISLTVIPMLANMKDNKINVFLSKLSFMLLVTSLLILIFVMFFRNQIINLVGYGFTEEVKNISSNLLMLGAPISIFIFQSTLSTSFLNHKSKFIIPALIGIPYNIVIIFFLV